MRDRLLTERSTQNLFATLGSNEMVRQQAGKI